MLPKKHDRYLQIMQKVVVRDNARLVPIARIDSDLSMSLYDGTHLQQVPVVLVGDWNLERSSPTRLRGRWGQKRRIDYVIDTRGQVQDVEARPKKMVRPSGHAV